MVNILEKILSFLIIEFSTKEESFQKLEKLKFQQIQTSVTYYKDSAMIKLSNILIQWLIASLYLLGWLCCRALLQASLSWKEKRRRLLKRDWVVC